MKYLNLFYALVLMLSIACKDDDSSNLDMGTDEILYRMPEESEPHEGTWLQWPHHFQYGQEFRSYVEPSWVEMAYELSSSENVHIIVYNEAEKTRIINTIANNYGNLSNVDYHVYPNDDFWIRDNGPIYARDQNNKLVIQDWGFNGWGEKADFSLCNAIPSKIANAQQRTLVDLNQIMINEGGAIEIDGHGALMATKSAILNSNRNPGMTQNQAESIFRKYLGITHFIWLEGKKGGDITDQHIDGFARFANPTTILTMNTNDLLDFDVRQSDINLLLSAQQENGDPYQYVKLPLTQNDVVTSYGQDLGYKGSYINFYVANTKVLVPNYQDPNDSIAMALIQNIYPGRTVVGIDTRNMYANGGMIHCVTQQQPID